MLILPRLIVVICIGIVLFAAIACSSYSPKCNTVHEINHHNKNGTNQGDVFDAFVFLQVDENGMSALCRDMVRGDYKRVKAFLEKIATPNPAIFDDVIYLITGCKAHKNANRQYPKTALLAQVITAYEDELLEYTHTEALLDVLFTLLRNYAFDLEKAFLQKHGEGQETIMHLAVDTANLAVIKCLVTWLKQGVGNDDYRLMKVCSMTNRQGETPLSKVVKTSYYHSLRCSQHQNGQGCEICDHQIETRNALRCAKHQDDQNGQGCEICDHQIEMRIRREEIVLYLLELGVPIESILHYYIRHNAGDFSIEIMEAIQNRAMNRYTREDVVLLKDRKEKTLLFYAVQCCNDTLATYLIKLGACPMQPNHKGISPILLAVALRDLKMVQCLSKAQCIERRICNINKQSSNGLTALEVARSPDVRGICPSLKKYYNKCNEQYTSQIVHKKWDWTPNDDIIDLLSALHNDFECNTGVRKRKYADLQPVPIYGLNPNKRLRMQYTSAANGRMMPSIASPSFSCALLVPTPSPYGGG